MNGTSGRARLFRTAASRTPWLSRPASHRTWTSPIRPTDALKQRAYATEAAPPKATKSRRRLYIVSGIVVAAAGAVAVSDDARYIWIAARRTGRVVSALALNINDYRRTLNQHDVLPEPEYQALLKNCHQRCADRTLVVLQKNGSIFVKLGQHLSSMNYLLPSEWCDTFIPLQDQCPVSSMESVEAMVLKDTGNTL
ncbi:ABC1-domain-containing protein, partial [Aureobasidium melanogenum]